MNNFCAKILVFQRRLKQTQSWYSFDKRFFRGQTRELTDWTKLDSYHHLQVVVDNLDVTINNLDVTINNLDVPITNLELDVGINNLD